MKPYRPMTGGRHILDEIEHDGTTYHLGVNLNLSLGASAFAMWLYVYVDEPTAPIAIASGANHPGKTPQEIASEMITDIQAGLSAYFGDDASIPELRYEQVLHLLQQLTMSEDDNGVTVA